MKLLGKVGSGLVNKWLNFGGDPVTDTDRDTGKTALAEVCTVPVFLVIRLHCSTAVMQPVATDGAGWFRVCLSVTIVRPEKTAELIRMPFRMLTRVGSRNDVLDGVQIPPREEATLKGKMVAIVNHRDSPPWAVQKWLYRSKCSLWCRVRCVQEPRGRHWDHLQYTSCYHLLSIKHILTDCSSCYQTGQ